MAKEQAVPTDTVEVDQPGQPSENGAADGPIPSHGDWAIGPSGQGAPQPANKLLEIDGFDDPSTFLRLNFRDPNAIKDILSKAAEVQNIKEGTSNMLEIMLTMAVMETAQDGEARRDYKEAVIGSMRAKVPWAFGAAEKVSAAFGNGNNRSE